MLTAPERATGVAAVAPATPEASPSSGTILSDRAVVIDPAGLVLLSDPTELAAGVYRFRRISSTAPEIAEGQYIIGESGGGYLRRVTGSSRSGELISLQTVEAYWPEVINGGVYRYVMALGGVSPRTSSRFPAAASPGFPINPSGFVVPLDIDFCNAFAGLDGLPDEIRTFQLCNRPGDGKCVRKIVASVVVEVCGKITRLETTGQLTLSGELEVELDIDPGGIIPPTLPVYFPCNVYPAACGFTGFCIEGTQVLVQVVPPRFETCRLVKAGTPLQVIPPSVRNAGIVGRPVVTSNIDLLLEGDARVELDLPIPGYAFAKEFRRPKIRSSGDSLVFARLAGGLFIGLNFKIIGASLTLGASPVLEHEFKFGWSSSAGWGHQSTLKRFELNPHLDFGRPDSVVGRLAFRPLIALQVGILPELPLLGGKVQLGASFDLPFLQDAWSRPPGGNWKNDLDAGIAVSADAVLTLPLGFSSITGVKLDEHFDRDLWTQHLLHMYGRGDLIVTVVASGTDRDPDGYGVSLTRLNPLSEPPFSGVLTGSIPSSAGSFQLSAAVPRFDKRCLQRFPIFGFLGLPTVFNCELAAEPHVLELTGIAGNCAVAGLNPRVVRLEPDTVLTDTVSVRCWPPGDPPPSSLDVTTATTGSDPDEDGYLIDINGVPAGRIGANGTARLSGLTPGDLVVQLTDIAPNCGVTSANPQTVTVAPGSAGAVAFAVACVATTQLGSLTVTAATTGDDLDADGFYVLLDGLAVGAVGANGSLTLSGVLPGDRSVELTGVATNCTVEGSNPRTARVPAGGVAHAAFTVRCTRADPVGDLQVQVVTSGRDIPSGYTVRAGGVEATVTAQGTITLTGIPVGTVTVGLSDIPANCSSAGPNPRTVTIVEKSTVATTFEVTCRNANAASRNEINGSIVITGLRDAGRGSTGSTGQSVRDQVLELALDGALMGSGVLTRSFNLNRHGDGATQGGLELDVSWNGGTGTFSGTFAGNVKGSVVTMSGSVQGDGAFAGLKLQLDLSGPLQGPFTYTGRVLTPNRP